MEYDWEKYGVECIPVQQLSIDLTDGVQRRKCPLPVLLLGLFEIGKGLVFAVVLAIVLMMPDADVSSGISSKVSTSVFARGNIASPVVLIILSVVSVYAIVIGFALLRLNAWAKNTLMSTSVMSVVRWMRYLFFFYAVSGSPLRAVLQYRGAYAALLLDVIVFLCVASNANSFRE